MEKLTTDNASTGLMSMSIPYDKGQITVQVRVSGESLKPGHLAYIRKHLELAEKHWQDERL